MRALAGFALVLFAALPAQAQNATLYRCADGTVVPVDFYKDTRSVQVQIDGKALKLPQKLFSLVGTRYAAQGVSLRISKDRIDLRRKGARYISCIPQ
jgi:membrane-bound inhibitor of C-type lysozyme